MRVIKEKTVYNICQIGKYKSGGDNLTAWLNKAKEAKWTGPADVKKTFPKASIIDSKRVVFNIRGNEFRLVVDIEYRLHSVFIIWFGTHQEYEVVDIKRLRYGNKNY